MRTRERVRVVRLFLHGSSVLELAWRYRVTSDEIEDIIREAMRKQEKEERR